MGSYFNHVAAKVLGRPVVLQPRVPSLFEPPPALRMARLGPIPFLNANPESRPASADSLPSGNLPSLTRPSTPTSSSYSDEQASERRRPPANQDQAVGQRILGRKREQPVAFQTDAVDGGETVGASVATEKPLRPKSQIVPASPSRTEQRGAKCADPPMLTGAEVTTWRQSPSDERRSEITVRQEPAPPVLDPLSSMRPETRVLATDRTESSISSSRPTSNAPDFQIIDSRESKDSGLSVSVVIGRVNVQVALPQPAPVRLSRPTPPPMLSLEQYMKQRGGQG
jgi:hypothetical protein